MKLYKLTDEKGQTKNETQWGEGVTHSIPFSKREVKMCSDGVLHGYKNLDLGLLMNPVHACISHEKIRIFIANGEIEIDDEIKVGCYEMTTEKEIEVPPWFKNEKIRLMVQLQFAILCADLILHISEKKYSIDSAPKEAIKISKKILEKLKNNSYISTNLIKDARYAAYYSISYASHTTYDIVDNTAKAASFTADAAANAVDDATDVSTYDNATYDDAAYDAAYAAAITNHTDGINLSLIANEAIKKIIKKED